MKIAQMLRQKPDADLEENIKRVYDDTNTTNKTRNGEWKIFSRKGKLFPALDGDGVTLPDGFIALYKTEGKPCAVFSGPDTYLSSLDSTIDVVTKEILEQPLKRKPLQYFEGNREGNKIPSLIFFTPITGFMAYMIYDASHFLVTETGSVLFSKSISYPLAMVGLAFAAMIVPKTFTLIGRIADEMRERKLPSEAASFWYGPKAELTLKGEIAYLDLQKGMIDDYSKISGQGADISPKDFAGTYALAAARLRPEIVGQGKN